VITTAPDQAADAIQSVDLEGTSNLIDAAKAGAPVYLYSSPFADPCCVRCR